MSIKYFNGTTLIPLAGQAQSSGTTTSVSLGYCSTLSEIADKTVICTNYTALENSYIQIILANSNTLQDALTLNINSQGSKPIYINGVVSSSTNYTLPAGTYFVYYDGINYYFRTDGEFTSNSINIGVNAVSMQYDTTNECISFVFN